MLYTIFKVIFLFSYFFTNIFLLLAYKKNSAHVASFTPKIAILAPLAHVALNELKITILASLAHVTLNRLKIMILALFYHINLIFLKYIFAFINFILNKHKKLNSINFTF